METTIYLIRHAEPFKVHYGIKEVSESILFFNIKTPLSIHGEKQAETISKDKEFDKLDVVWSSDYVRAMSTAKYFAFRNDLKVNISDKFGERKHGITSWEELPTNFEKHQFLDENYKIGNGESQKEVRDRMFTALWSLLNQYKGKRILIVTHSTAIAYLLGKWCEINYIGSYRFKRKDFFDGNWNYCEVFKLVFDKNNNLLTVTNIKV